MLTQLSTFEILQCVDFLAVNDILHYSSTCTKLARVVTKTNSVWCRLCERDGLNDKLVRRELLRLALEYEHLLIPEPKPPWMAPLSSGLTSSGIQLHIDFPMPKTVLSLVKGNTMTDYKTMLLTITNNYELEHAVKLWAFDKEASLQLYGHMSQWVVEPRALDCIVEFATHEITNHH